MLSPRGTVKFLVLWSYVYLWAPCRNAVRRLLGRAHVVVLMYHRVSDDYKDSVTVGKSQFARQLRILKQRMPVVGIGTLLAEQGRRRWKACAAITFDDGYEDNYEASKVLRALELPCAFFISTRIVGTDQAFPHDLRRLGHRVPALRWSQIREMAEWGFEFGNHTATHQNLGQLSLEEARAEIQAAQEDLLREVGSAGRGSWLAYPFGKPQDIRSDVRQALQDLGVECCLSAYGGTNPPDLNPMDIRRQGVDHTFSDLAFKAVLEGWRVR